MINWLLVIMALVIVLLIVKNYHYRRQLSKINDIIVQIKQGNFNQRFRIQTNNHLLQELSGNLNRLIDNFQNTFERVKYLEDSRKQMISNISHDLRTPLTSLLGYIDMLQNEEDLTPEEVDNYLEIVRNKGEHLSRLLQDFFEFSKLEAQDTLVKFNKVDIKARVEEIVLNFYQDFVNAGITPEISMPDQPVYVWGDDNSIERVLSNLLSNALKYGKDGKVIGLNLKEDEDKVLLEVWDRGKGIKEEDLPHIFDRLYTGESSRNEKMRGSGLGLTIAQKLIEQINGEIGVTSIPGEKTTFSITLKKVS